MTDNNNKGGSIPFSEDDQVAGTKAKEMFLSKDFDGSLQLLKKLSKNHTNDPHLLHNRGLNEFLKSNGTRVAEFKKILTKVYKQIKNKQDDEDIVSNDKSGFMCVQFNLSLIYFKLHQYSSSVQILEPLVSLNENVDNYDQVKLEVLLLESCILTHATRLAEKLLEKLEKYAFVEVNCKPQQTEEKTKAAGIEISSAEKDNFKRTIGYLKSRCLLMSKSIKICKREIKNFSSLSEVTSTDPLSNKQHHHLVFLKSNFEFVKGNHLKALRIITNVMHSSLDKNVTPPPLNSNITALYKNNIGVIYFMLNKFSLACHHMNDALAENKKSVENLAKQHTVHNSTSNNSTSNNSGAAGGNNRNNNTTAPLSVKSLEILNKNSRFELMYNHGLCLLHAGFSLSAFEVLNNATQAFSNNPRLWLRLAECCIQKCTGCGKDENGLNRSGGGSKKSQAAMYSTFTEVGSGCHRKLVIRPINNHLSNSKHNLSSTQSPPASMEYAAACLRNALTILCSHFENGKSSSCNSTTDEKTEKKEEKERKSIDYDNYIVPCLPGAPVTGSSLIHLMAAVLVNSAYVALHLGDSLSALHYCDNALRLPELAGSHKYLAHTYAAEALVSLDKIPKAISHLSGHVIDNIAPVVVRKTDESGKKSPSSDDDKTKMAATGSISHNAHLRKSYLPWHFPSDVFCARAYTLFNLAATHCLRSEYSKAENYIKKGQALLPKGEPTPPHAILLSVYLHLHLDNVEGPKKALQILFQHKLAPDENSCPNAFFREMEAIGYRQKLSTTKMERSYSSAAAMMANSRSSKSATPQSLATQSAADKAAKIAGNKGNSKSRRR